jgi:DNA repair protein RecO (recombination protein O)
MYIKTDGIVLREVAYQDSDKLLTVLTREYGKLTVRARGVRSSRSQVSRPSSLSSVRLMKARFRHSPATSARIAAAS